jgi:hypothetical protein
MRLAIFLALAFCACLFQVSWMAAWPLGPELPLALAAWAMIDGTEDGMPLRAWLVGVLYDLMDPGSVWFHAVAYLLIAVALLPIRKFFFRRRATGWAVWAAACSLLLVLMDGWTGGFGDTTATVAAAQALLTAAAAAAIGWMVAVLPRRWHPLGEGGA